MLSNPEAFAQVEQMLMDNGTIAQFEADQGPITGRMMIDRGTVPSTLADSVPVDEDTVVFTGTFDFCNSAVGVAVNTKTGKQVGKVWIEEQKTGAYQPTEEWVKYFLNVLADGIRGGSYGVPIYAFVNDKAGFELYPSAPDEEE